MKGKNTSKNILAKGAASLVVATMLATSMPSPNVFANPANQAEQTQTGTAAKPAVLVSKPITDLNFQTCLPELQKQ